MGGKNKILLIGGASHMGKSRIAKFLASHLGWSYRSTDKLARHPGRPWQEKQKEVPEHVADHYLLLPADELINSVLRHYGETVGPLFEDIVTSHATDQAADNLVMEGSAILPELVVTFRFDNIAAVWLTASNEFIRRRIYAASQYKTKSRREKTMVDKFLTRNQLFNERIVETVNRFGLMSMNIENTSNIEELAAKCLSKLK
ncbi:MAG: 2-phosphoglycerate kinase [Proteobacteria bacterium]|nr:2-phosphoglycerate kinase [Pseudomonadota bacterium]